jgi:hypothetical protein
MGVRVFYFTRLSREAPLDGPIGQSGSWVSVDRAPHEVKICIQFSPTRFHGRNR